VSRCRHRDRRGFSLVDFYLADGTLAGAFDGHRLFRGRCPRCGDVSLGPATDTPETAVEVRAAELIAEGWSPDVLRAMANDYYGMFNDVWDLAATIAENEQETP
jgi:hypothetical protein